MSGQRKNLQVQIQYKYTKFNLIIGLISNSVAFPSISLSYVCVMHRVKVANCTTKTKTFELI